MRLEQLLGLPPHNGQKWFVEIWVKPTDLFRPSADPKVTAPSAGIVFPVFASEKHIAWYESPASSSYGDDGYPWTRLEYTYDGGNPATEIGLSEYVIAAVAEITIHRLTANTDYFSE